MRKLWECVQRFGNWCTNHKAITAFVFAFFVLSIPLHYTHAVDSELFTKFLTNPIDVVMLTLAGIIQVVTGAIGKLILLIIQVIVIPVLGYNGFYNSHITNLGWSLVRDVVNMFVVVVLMVIAIMTIVGYSKANWTQQLPRLFIAIVLVNFSKLICGFLIDVSQVIMFTFVNAIVSIAAGNFASMLSMDSFGQLNADFIDKINATGVGMGAFEFLMGAYLQFIVMLAILGVMFLLAAAFVWRIVVLWILIIMSPMAFFLGGIKDVFGAAGKSYEEWWSKFSSALTFGPVMCFFLWLALAASSGSNLARTEDFPMPESQNDTGLQLEMFSLDNFLGMFIALAILIAGMQQASSSAQALGGFASKMLSEDMGKGLVKGIARSPFAAAGGFKKERAWMNEKAKKGGAFAETYAPAGLTKGVGNALAKTGTALSGIRGLGGLGNAVAAVGGNVVKGAKETQKESVKLGGDQFKERTDAQAATLDASAAANGGKGSNAFNSLPKDEQDAYLKSFGTDIKRRDKFRENLEKSGMSKEDARAAHDALFARSSKFLESDGGKTVMDDTEKDRWQDTKFANLHLVGADEADPVKAQAARDKVWEKQEKDGRLNLGLISTDTLKSEAGGAYMKKKVARRENGKDITAWNDIAQNGKGTGAQRDAMIATITPADVRDSEKRKQSMTDLVRSGAVTKEDEGGGNARRDAVREQLGASAPADYAPRVYGKAAAAILDQTPDAGALFGTGFIPALSQETLGEDTREYKQADALLDADSNSVRHLNGAINPEQANAASALATSKINLEEVKRMRKTAGEATTDGGYAVEALDTMKNAVHAEMGRTDIDDDRRKTLKRVADELGTGARYASAGGGRGGRGGGGGGGGGGPTGGGAGGPVGGGGGGAGGPVGDGTGGPAGPAGGGAGGAAPAAGGGGGGAAPAAGGGGATAGAAGATAAQRFVARGRAVMEGKAAAAAAPEPAQQTAAQKFVARGRATMAANAASAEPTSNSRPPAKIRTSAAGTSAAPRTPDRYGSAKRSNSAAPRPSDTYGSAARPNSAAPRPSNEYRSGPTNTPSAGGGAV